MDRAMRRVSFACGVEFYTLRTAGIQEGMDIKIVRDGIKEHGEYGKNKVLHFNSSTQTWPIAFESVKLPVFEPTRPAM